MNRDDVARPRILRAELLRWKRSLPHRLVYVVGVYGLLVTVMFLASPMDATWEALFGWHNVWAVTVGPIYAILLGSAVTGMDQRNRAGGTLWRRVDSTKARASRVLVLVLHVVAANVLALVIPIALASVAGLGAGAPWGRAVVLALVCGLSQSALAVLAVVLARLINPIAALFVGVAFALSWVFVDTVETSRWMQWPANWLVRGTLPLTQTHANGVALEPDSPLRQASIWAPAALSLALAAVLSSFEPTPLRDIVDRVRTRRHLAKVPTPVVDPAAVQATDGRPVRRDTIAVDTIRVERSRPRPARAVLAVIAPTWVPWAIVAMFVVGLLFLRWRPADDVVQLLAVVIVPAAASVLPLALWNVLAPGWRGVASRSPRTLRPVVTVVATSVAALGLLAGLSVAFLTTRGLDAGLALRVWLNCLIVSAFVVPTVLWVATRFGTAVAGSISLFGIIFGVLIGGSGLMDSLWPFMPWAWGGLSGISKVLVAALVTVVVAPTLTRLAASATLRTASAD